MDARYWAGVRSPRAWWGRFDARSTAGRDRMVLRDAGGEHVMERVPRAARRSPEHQDRDDLSGDEDVFSVPPPGLAEAAVDVVIDGEDHPTIAVMFLTSE